MNTPMTPDRLQQMRALFEEAVELPPEARRAFVEANCGHDSELEAQVWALIEADAQDEALVDQPALSGFQQKRGQDHARLEGRRIGPYLIRRRIGQGGMGVVYLATRDDDVFHKEVAIKVLRPGAGSADVVRRFRQEREILASLDHPNIARLLDGGTTPDGFPYFVMEYVAGQPIDRYCDEHKLNVTQRVRLFQRVCSAVHYAHQKLVVHRDLKPSNILVTGDEDVKLLDFGIAKLLRLPEATDPDEAATLYATREGVHLMTPEYASPEQVKGEPITTASDTYSLGVVLYELVTGHRPYRMKSRLMHEVVRVICEEDPTRPSAVVTRSEESTGEGPASKIITAEQISELREGKPARLKRRLTGDLDHILLQVLRKEPERRYSSVDRLREDLSRHLEGLPVTAQKNTLWYRANKLVRRHAILVAAGFLLVLSLVAGLSATAWQARRAVKNFMEADRQRTRAEQERRNTQALAIEARREQANAERQAAEASAQRLVAEAERATAQRRFDELRKLSNSLFEIEAGIRDLPGATATRKLLVTRALTYLDGLAAESGGDPSLRQEIAGAYEQIADVQGDPNGPNLGEWRNALGNYRAALAMWEEQIRKAPAAHRNHARWWRTFVKTAMKLHDLGDLEGQRSHIRNGLRVVQGFDAARDPNQAADRAGAEWVRASARSLDGNRSGALEGWNHALGAMEAAVKRSPADASLRDEFLIFLHATTMALGNRADPSSELPISGTLLRCHEEAAATRADGPAGGDLGLILAIRGRALVASGDTANALESYRRALTAATALLARSPRHPVGGFVLASALLDLSTSFRSEPVAEALNQYRKYLEAARESAQADPVNAEARGVLYARLSDMAEILEIRVSDEAAEFHRRAAAAGADLETHIAQGRPVSAEWGARQRFYHLRRSDNPADAAGLLGLRVSVLQQVGQASEEVDPAKEFHSGDRIRVRIEPNTDGYFYLVNRTANGTWRLIWPATGEANAGWSRQPQFFPPGGRLMFDDQPGVEQLYVIFSKTPRPEWVAEIGKPIRFEDLLRLLNRYQTTPQYETVGTATSVKAPASREHALYAAQPASDAGRPLILEVRLNHGR
jgi:serine/threonine protein kinase